ncbi:CUE domain-containing protein 1-like isoform X2 [Denticeps clupeoides]|uniref:CUE domain-containing protein n=2 Tax=Denticeps clupeoides TaxID=299321 RepID=A0AAY4D0K3_9TELE|nr:CUE domain-containing protein 1-like isoform X2 [Denticeps clupeoides]
MTSLFRRSASSSGGGGSNTTATGGSHDAERGGGSAAASNPAQLNNSRGPRQVRRLEFNQAMGDFKTMFPAMDHEVIECVLRANNGAVDSTIDQLLQMSIDGQGSDDTSDSEDSIPPEILERTLEPDSSDEEAPPVYSPPSYDMHIYDRKHPADVPPTPPPRFEAHVPPGHRQVGTYRNWNPPLLGNLPDDFLRILPQQLDSLQRSHSSLSQPSSSSSSSLSSLSQALVPGEWASEEDRKLKQYLEDERIALFLQNEEFMRELQRNRDFLIALERDRQKYESKISKANHSSACMENCRTGDHCASGPEEACTSVPDDALFRDKLKHMGKSTRKKLFEIARSFSEKTRRRKTKKRALLKHHSLGTAASTANLLDDVEGSPCGHPANTCICAEEAGQPRRPGTQEEEEPNKEAVS